MSVARLGAAGRPWTIYPGWWVAAGACLSLGLAAGMSFWAFGLFVGPLQAEFGWSRSAIAGATSLSLLVSGCASPLVGRLVDRYGPRAVILIGTAGTATGYLLLSRMGELWHLFAVLGLLAFFRTWIFYVPFTTLITRWFTRRRATAMGIATSGFGLGGLVFLPLTAELLTAVGWRVAFAAAALLVVLINGAFLVLVRDDPPAAWATHDAGAGPGRPRPPPAPGGGGRGGGAVSGARGGGGGAGGGREEFGRGGAGGEVGARRGGRPRGPRALLVFSSSPPGWGSSCACRWAGRCGPGPDASSCSPWSSSA